MKNKIILNRKGEADYDYKNDILFFKVKDKEYAKSIELNNIIVDIDFKGLIIGIQIFEASSYLNTSKSDLLKISKWQLNVIINNQILEIRLIFNIEFRNKIIEKNPIITQSIEEVLPNSELNCAIS